MNIIRVTCYHCGRKFQKTKGRFNESVKFGWKKYCSNKCQFTTRLTGTTYACSTCGNDVWRTPKELKQSKTQKFFCNTSCAAIYNNRLRNEALPKNFCKHPNCSNQIPRDQLYCSRSCAIFSRKRTIESLRQEVLSGIRNFHKLNNRIPVKKERYALYGKASDAFGSWNKAIKAAGFKPNPVMFARKYMAMDGHRCDSFAEKIINDWLHLRGISHTRNVPYPNKRLSCDFVVNGIFIEFLGLEGEHKRYTELVKEKRKLAQKYKLKLVEIKPQKFFPKNNLETHLGFLL